jgi:hypothetical protein
MRKLMTAAFALSAVAYAGMVVTAQAEIGGGAPMFKCFNSTGHDAHDDRDRLGVWVPCSMRAALDGANPRPKPRPPTVSSGFKKRTASQTALPAQAVSAATVYCTLGRCYENWSECARQLDPWGWGVGSTQCWPSRPRGRSCFTRARSFGPDFDQCMRETAPRCFGC